MSKKLHIKNHSISSDRASIFVPVVSKDFDSIISDVKLYIESGVSFIELRADYFEGLKDSKKLELLLSGLGDLCKETVLLFTIRTVDEGGLASLSEEEYLSIISQAARSGAVDLVDFEIYKLSDPSRTFEAIKAMDVGIVASHHNFSKTYEKGKILSIYRAMDEAGADIIKLAMMPETRLDVLGLMTAAQEYREESPDSLLVAISMGELGKPTRVMGSYVGSCITFAALKDASAPGQIGFSQMKDLLDILNY